MTPMPFPTSTLIEIWPLTLPQSQDLEHQESGGASQVAERRRRPRLGRGPKRQRGEGDGWEHVLPAKS